MDVPPSSDSRLVRSRSLQSVAADSVEHNPPDSHGYLLDVQLLLAAKSSAPAR